MKETYADKIRNVASTLDRMSEKARESYPVGSAMLSAAIVNAQSEAMGELLAIVWGMYREAAKKATRK